jgi:hypothetical protein
MHDAAGMRTPSIATRTAAVYVRYVAAHFHRLNRQLGRYALADMHWIEGDLAVPTRLSDAR